MTSGDKFPSPLRFLGYVASILPSLFLATNLCGALPSNTIESSKETSNFSRTAIAPNLESEGDRTVQNVVWSCIATVFACTWVAIHPNLPDPRCSKWSQFRLRLAMMVLTIFAPEFILIWAFRQRLGARKITKEYNQNILGLVDEKKKPLFYDLRAWFRNPPLPCGRRQWTTTHGFYVQMGGFLVHEEGSDWPIRVLTFPDLIELINSGVIDPPAISEEEICDKSKGDFFSKVVVIVQTTWFMVQCFARWTLKLPVTDLEVATFSFAVLNIVTYALWFHKPQNISIGTMIPIKLRNIASNSTQPGTVSHDGAIDELDIIDMQQKELESPPALTERVVLFADGPETGSNGVRQVDLEQSFPSTQIVASNQSHYHSIRSRVLIALVFLPQTLYLFWKGIINAELFTQFRKVALGCTPTMKARRTIISTGKDPNAENTHIVVSVTAGPLAVETFYAEDADSEGTEGKSKLILFVISSGLLFGGLHLVPWRFSFPTEVEARMWRVSALYIMLNPILLLFPLILFSILKYRTPIRSKFRSNLIRCLPWLTPPVRVITVAVPLYILARPRFIKIFRGVLMSLMCRPCYFVWLVMPVVGMTVTDFRCFYTAIRILPLANRIVVSADFSYPESFETLQCLMLLIACFCSFLKATRRTQSRLGEQINRHPTVYDQNSFTAAGPRTLLTVFFSRQVLSRMPLISLHHWISELDRRQDTVNQSTDDLRTTRDIIWSCLATIFACTWIAMHPNLPDPQDTKVARFKRRVIVMLVALVAPEYILLWALKQRMAAGIIAKEYNRIIHSRPRADQTCSTLSPCYRHPAGVQGPQKWTIVHGFFLQMGGILIADGNTGCPEKALTLPLLKELIELGEVNPIELSEEEIEDKSKGDILTKLLVVLQTSWFVLQCLARWATQLSVTELEVMTFSFAILNVITYALWWYKPQNVCVPVIIHRKPKQTQDIEYGVWESRSPGFSTFENFPPPLPPPRCHHQDSSENEMDITDSVALSQASQYEVPEICATSDQSIYPQGISEFRSSAAQYPTRSQPRWAWCFDKLASVLRQSITYPKTALDRIGRLLKSIWEAKLYRKVIVAVGPQSDNSHLTSSLKFATVDSERHATFPDGAECGLNSPMLPDISAELRTYAVGTFHASEIDGSPGYYYYCLVVLGEPGHLPLLTRWPLIPSGPGLGTLPPFDNIRLFSASSTTHLPVLGITLSDLLYHHAEGLLVNNASLEGGRDEGSLWTQKEQPGSLRFSRVLRDIDSPPLAACPMLEKLCGVGRKQTAFDWSLSDQFSYNGRIAFLHDDDAYSWSYRDTHDREKSKSFAWRRFGDIGIRNSSSSLHPLIFCLLPLRFGQRDPDTKHFLIISRAATNR
ncbi:hypothetical protein NP233_g6878 [Leucocoprinus birnbaumii]|uniref:Uncharacterized protein n=1 Tax=Leucocoprinus birnbaumii TaxID=56174 RepID=A0AAD5YTA7_9AGAR|nr:hypothetical protein NP233_g6878 [Leucocoprinus birnbaumii]